MTFRKTLTLAFTLLIALTGYAKNSDYLAECKQKHGNFGADSYLKISFEETYNKLYHAFKPWQAREHQISGTIWCNANDFLKSGTLHAGEKTYDAKSHLTKTELLEIGFGEQKLTDITKDRFIEATFKTARYTPVFIIDYFIQHKIPLSKESTKELAIYTVSENDRIATLYINKTSKLVQKVTILEFDELYGDVLTTYTYNEYQQAENANYATLIDIEKFNGKLTETVSILSAEIVTTAPELVKKPNDYSFIEEKEKTPEINVVDYTERIRFIELKHTDDRILMVEFEDFLLIAEAPLNSENGELIIAEAKKIVPNKPIKYFVFGHHHNHYTGGLRAFVHEEATILCVESNNEYVNYLATASHSLHPDKLEQIPIDLKIENIDSVMTITDGTLTMEIHFIGEKSAHTADYLIYYFPNEKMLFQDDLVWIKKEGEIQKAGARQAGLYNAIKDLNLTVETIIQSWPVDSYGVKTVIPFTDLEQSMNVTE